MIKRVKWTSEETEHLKSVWEDANISVKDILKYFPNKTERSLYSKAATLKLKRTLNKEKLYMPEGKNSIAIDRPDLIKYFKNPEDAYKYTVQSGRKCDLKCPYCGEEKPNVTIQNLSLQGFCCKKCGNTISKPNRFMYGVLSQVNVDFIPEKIFEWATDKKYDFYIPSLSMIIEMHGSQHYRECFEFTRETLQETQENDELKERLAKENGIKIYCVINSRRSDSGFLKKNTLISLDSYLDLSNIVWADVFKYSAQNINHLVWDLYNDNKSVEEICSLLNLRRIKVQNCLITGTRMGVCDYKGLRKGVAQYSLDGELIKEYPSMKIAADETGTRLKGISAVCNGLYSTSGGFIWKHSDFNYYSVY